MSYELTSEQRGLCLSIAEQIGDTHRTMAYPSATIEALTMRLASAIAEPLAERIAELEAALREIDGTRGDTIYNDDREFMTGANEAFKRCADMASEALRGGKVE